MCRRQSRGLSWVVMWARRVGKKRMDKWFGSVELKAMKTMEQPTIN